MKLKEFIGRVYDLTTIVPIMFCFVCSGCGSVGRAVASDTRGSNPVIGKNLFILNIWLLSTVYWKDENKEKKRPGMAHFKSFVLIEIVRTVVHGDLKLKELKTSVTRWLNYIKVFGHLLQWWFAQKHNFFKVVSKWRNFAKSGHTAKDSYLTHLTYLILII